MRKVCARSCASQKGHSVAFIQCSVPYLTLMADFFRTWRHNQISVKLFLLLVLNLQHRLVGTGKQIVLNIYETTELDMNLL